MLSSCGDERIDTLCSKQVVQLDRYFNVRAGFGFYDDSKQPNAIALTKVYNRRTPDGTVLLGKSLVHTVLRGEDVAIAVIMAHEWAHIQQFREKARFQWNVRYELNADALAGGYFSDEGGFFAGRAPVEAVKEKAAEVFYERGDTHFFEAAHHGTAKQRSDAFRQGAGLVPRVREVPNAEASSTEEAK